MTTKRFGVVPQAGSDRAIRTHGWTDILGVKVSAINMQLAVDTIETWIDSGRHEYVCVCTVHTITEAMDDPVYREILNGAGLRTPDGMPLVWLSRRAGQGQVKRVYGPDLMLELCNRSQVSKHRHYFYGGGPGVTDLLIDRLTERFPNLQVAGAHTPGRIEPGDREQADVLAAINAARPDIVWVGLGTPKQDWWIANHRPLLEAPVLIAVGAAFDFHSGTVKQSPLWMQRCGLEWAYRLSNDPRRLWKRYVFGNSRFIAGALRSKFDHANF
jgi:N-acetylglucosaminyldiphosphoundecaprenol N-acetyl-beta-D-mannosaminyltransferase